MNDEPRQKSGQAVHAMPDTMAAQDAIVQWFEQAWLGGNVELVRQVFTKNVLVHTPNGEVKGVDALCWAATEAGRLADSTGTCEVVGQEGDEFAVSYVLHGRHVER